MEDANLTRAETLAKSISKWKTLAAYVCDKSEGIELKGFGFGDKTAVYKEPMVTKQFAERGVKNVSAGTSGMTKLHILRINKGVCAPNRPVIKVARNPRCIRHLWN